MSGAEDYFGAVARQQAGAAASNVFALRDTNPDAAARANVLARELELPADAVERNLPEAEANAQQHQARTIMGKYPVIAGWTADPRNAAIARDDMENLGKITKVVQNHLSLFAFNPSSYRKASDAELDAATATPGMLVTDIGREGAVASGLLVRRLVEQARNSEAPDQVIANLPGQAARGAGAGVFDLTSGTYGVGRMLSENAASYSPIAWVQRRLFGTSIENELATFFARRQQEGEAIAQNVAGEQPKSFVAKNLVAGIRSIPTTAAALAASAMGAPEAGAGFVGASVAGQEYGRARDKGISPGRATVYAASQGLIEFATERVPALKYFEDTQAGASFAKKLIDNLGSEMPQEQIATVLQDLNEWAVLNPDKPFSSYLDERPNAALATAIATAAGASVSVSAVEAAGKLTNGAVKAAMRKQDAEQAQANAVFLDNLAKGVTESKVAKRDGSALANFLAMQLGDTHAEYAYIPAGRVAEFFQAADYDWRDSEHAWNFVDDFAGQVDRGLASGGDVVVKTADLAAHMAGTPAWEALKDHIRLSPGGMSVDEARNFAKDESEAYEALGKQFADDLERQRLDMRPREMLYESIRDKLTNAGFTQDAADRQALLLVQRAETRAARLGKALTGTEYDNLKINQVLPAGLAPVVAADQLDIAIDVLKRSRDPKKADRGLSLLDWIAKQGGVEDRGGDIKSMGGDKWHVGKPGKRKLIKPHDDTASFLPGQKHANTPDDLAMRAWEAGYFPEYNERPDVNALLEAIGEGIAGRERFAREANGADDAMRAAVGDLEALLDQQGLDPDKASKADIRKAVERYQAKRSAGQGYDQFAGVRAHGTPFGSLSRAEEMEEAGASADDIKEATNWHRGDDFKWRWEISDKGAMLRWSKLEGVAVGDVYRLGDILIHKALFDAYPVMADLPVEVKAGGGGSFDGKRIGIGEVNLSEKRKPGHEGVGVLLHEIQHVIQFYEGFAMGAPSSAQGLRDSGYGAALDAEIARIRAITADGWGSAGGLEESEIETAAVRNVYRRASGEVEARSTQSRRDMSEDERRDAGERWSRDTTVADVLFPSREYAQSFADGPRGRITFPAAGFGTGPSVIDLFQARDLSTFVHETGHLWLEELRADASDPNAPESLKADWQTVQDWFAANGHPIVDGVIPVDAHELWARGWERYAMEGKSPSSALRRVFDAFRSWLLQIYKVVDNLRSPITPEIREVMDRLIATDEEIDQARETQNIKALFTDAAQAGMSEQEFAAYKASTEEARDEAFDALLYRTMAAIRAQRTQAWKDEEAGVRAEVTERVDRRPEFRALAALRAKEPRLKLDRAWLVETYGEDALKLLPGAVPPIYAEKDTTHADVIAEMNGFRTGDEMVRTLMGVGERTRQLREGGDQRSVRKVLIDEETAAVMRERHGDPLNDGSIEEEALAAIHNDRQGEVIASELRALSRKSNNRPTPYKIAREWAARTIAESRVVDSTSGAALQRYARAAAKAGKAAEEAMLKGDIDETFRQKQAQMLNNALIAEAKKAKDAVDAAVSRLGKLAKRATIKSIDQDYLDQVHQLLEQVEFRTVSQSALDERESYEAWATAQQAAGFDIVNPPSFAAQLGKRNWSRLSVEELLGLDETVKQIVHLGRLKQKLLDGKEEREFAAVIAEAQGAFDQIPPKPPKGLADPTWGEKFKAGVAGFDASLLKIETLVDWLDGGNPEGVFNRIVFRPIADAQDRANDMRADYLGRIAAAMNAMPPKTINRWQEKVDVGLHDRFTGKPWVATRQKLISLALNIGNEGNTQRLTDGYGWEEQQVRDVLNRELTADDWSFVQKVWDIIDTLWPQIEAMEKRVNGVVPEKVVAVPFETPHGMMRGGYYPAIYDSRLSVDAEVNAAKAADLFETIYTRANTRASATKERAAKVKRPILLDLGVINRHLGEVIHDITHREAIMQADKFLSDRRIMEGIDRSLGSEYRQQFRPWLKFVANQWAMERAGNEGAAKWFAKARTNTTVVGMGFRISTILTQIAGYSNSFEAVGASWVIPAIAQTTKNPVKTFNFVMEKSGEVRHRMDTLDRDIRTGLDQLAGKNGFISEAQRFAFHGIGLADRVVVIPTWIAAYNKALAAGEAEDAAIYAADKAVRQSQGSGSAKDMAAIVRGTGKAGELLKYTTMFYSYMSAVYQRQRTIGRDVRTAGVHDVPALMARALWLIMIPPILSQVLAGRGPDDDEDWGTWSFKQMLFNMLGPIPILRDVAQPAWDKAAGNKGFDYQLSPVQRAFQTGINTIGDISKIAKGDDTKRATRNALESAGYATGLIPGQIATAAQFLVDVGQGEQDPESVSDWWEGLTTGKVSAE